MDDNNAVVPGFDDDKNDDLTITLNKINTIKNGCLITLSGNIDTYNSPFFQNQITKVITAGYVNIIFKCTYLNYLSSTGLGAFTNLLKIVRVMNGDIVIADIQPKIQEYFDLLGFSQFFTLKTTLQEAAEYLNKEIVPDIQVFPKITTCPACKKSIKVTHACKVRCPGCASILKISDDGSIYLD